MVEILNITWIPEFHKISLVQAEEYPQHNFSVEAWATTIFFLLLVRFPNPRPHICHGYRGLYLWRKFCHVEKFQISVNNLNNLWRFIESYEKISVEKKWQIWGLSVWIFRNSSDPRAPTCCFNSGLENLTIIESWCLDPEKDWCWSLRSPNHCAIYQGVCQVYQEVAPLLYVFFSRFIHVAT